MTLRWWHWGAALLLLMAWNNAGVWAPSHWLHYVPPWSSMLIITRWRLWGSYLVLLGAVGGLVGLYAVGRRRVAWVLAAFLLIDLGGHVALSWHGKFPNTPPPAEPRPDPPVTLRGSEETFWPALRRNQATLSASCPVLRYERPPTRLGADEPAYAGEFHNGDTVEVRAWSPNRILLAGRPASLITANINPGNYWLVNGERYWPQARAVETAQTFQVRVPASGVVELVARPPDLSAFLGIQAACALLAVTLLLALRRKRRLQWE